ncbi:hypothetical protein [Primorskyibacter marinus]|uniref:hypothetical protein n=1 Tax=Primorskyibacter marinus TaxID=1977320 RepID=UPI000E30582B|nr:hypothetical protein [Primorskyibacter marinus]
MRPARRLNRALEAQVPQKALRDLTNRLRYGPDAPLSDETLYVDPRAILSAYSPKKSPKAPNFRRRHSGQVVGGDWDLARAPIEGNFKLISCRMHFEDGVPWDDTPLLHSMKAQIAAGKEPDECKTVYDLARRYARLDQIFAETRQTGRLKSRTETSDHYRREHGGIFVHVTRDGTMLRAGGGNHRFAIAWILGLPEIPVQLGVIHADAVREGLHKTLRLPLSKRTAPA